MSRDYEEDYQFFYKNRRQFIFTTRYVKPPVYKQGALGAKEAFKRYLVGKRRPTESSEPELLQELLVCRVTLLDFIRSEAENYVRYEGQPVAYFLSNFIDPPRWVLSMFIREVNIAQKNSETAS